MVQNIDHLFNEDELTAPYTPKSCNCLPEFDRSPSQFTISSGFFILKPDISTFEQMVYLASNPSPDLEDIRQFGGNWHWGDQEMLRVVFTQLSEGKLFGNFYCFLMWSKVGTS